MLNGALVKEKVNCDHCGKVSKMSCGKKDCVMFAYYVYKKKKLCRNCSKKIFAL